MKSTRSISIAAITVSCAVLLVYVMATARRVHATVPGTNGQIAFAQITGAGLLGSTANVFIANPDGSNVQQVPLVYPAETFGVPVWSPDGTKLLISHTIRLDANGQCCLFQAATVDPNGLNFNQFSGDAPGCDAWYPDGTRLLCSFVGNPPGVLSVRASDGGDPVRLTTYPFGPNCNACDFANDVSQFVFMRFRRENFVGRPEVTQQVAIYVENTDGTGLRQVAPYGVAMPRERASAKWSPDGTLIISTLSNGQLFVIRPDGGDLKTVKLQVGTQQYSAFEPHWSPDGTRIIFCMFINHGEGIYTANPDGSDVKQVTFTTDFSMLFNGPDWGRQPTQ
jgi:Tol biopolymer transport system component